MTIANAPRSGVSRLAHLKQTVTNGAIDRESKFYWAVNKM